MDQWNSPQRKWHSVVWSGNRRFFVPLFLVIGIGYVFETNKKTFLSYFHFIPTLTHIWVDVLKFEWLVFFFWIRFLKFEFESKNVESSVYDSRTFFQLLVRWKPHMELHFIRNFLTSSSELITFRHFSRMFIVWRSRKLEALSPFRNERRNRKLFITIGLVS